MIGVSPAFFLSKYKSDFTPAQVCESLPFLGSIGYSAIQVEITKDEAMSYWNRQWIQEVNRRCDDLGLMVSQVVAHHWIEDFSSLSALMEKNPRDRYETIFDLSAQFTGCRQVTVPFGRCVIDTARLIDRNLYDRVYGGLIGKMITLVEIASERGMLVALELQPGSLVSGSEGFASFWREIGSPVLGYNFDTGHAQACKELVELIPVRLGDRIFGTHLCDNHGYENSSLAPGDGTIDWSRLIPTLRSSGYEGSYDIEILCDGDSVDKQYQDAFSFVFPLLEKSW